MNKEDSLRYVNFIAPEHDRGSCNDTNLYNAAYSPDDFGGYGGCHRCTLLKVINGISQSVVDKYNHEKEFDND